MTEEQVGIKVNSLLSGHRRSANTKRRAALGEKDVLHFARRGCLHWCVKRRVSSQPRLEAVVLEPAYHRRFEFIGCRVVLAEERCLYLLVVSPADVDAADDANNAMRASRYRYVGVHHADGLKTVRTHLREALRSNVQRDSDRRAADVDYTSDNAGLSHWTSLPRLASCRHAQLAQAPRSVL